MDLLKFELEMVLENAYRTPCGKLPLKTPAGLVIIQDPNSLLRYRGFFHRPEICLYPLGCRVVKTFADERLIAAHFDHHDSLLGQPGMTPAQGSPRLHRRRVFFNLAVAIQLSLPLIPRRQRFCIDCRELRGFRWSRPARNI